MVRSCLLLLPYLLCLSPLWAQKPAWAQKPVRLPAVNQQPSQASDLADWSDLSELPELPEWSELSELSDRTERSDWTDPSNLSGLADPFDLPDQLRPAPGSIGSRSTVRTIPSFDEHAHRPPRIVRYDVPLADTESHHLFRAHGIEGELIDVPVSLDLEGDSAFERFKRRCQSFFGLLDEDKYPRNSRSIRYEVPADLIEFHASMSDLDGELVEPGMLRLPEVRFFQPKARVFMDLKRRNDDEFDLFSNGAVLASLDVVELYFPMPLISERFARALGKPMRQPWLGWRVGGTLGVGVTTALHNGDSKNGSAPITTFSSGVRYEFPLGRPSLELIQSEDPRLDQRTRVGIESGIQGGISTNESLADSTDVGFYLGILVNTPWTSYGG